jgi:hypothetical protein
MKAHGELRQAQLLTTFGPGSMVDLPDYSVIIGGLDQWRFPSGRKHRIHEDRLEAKLAQILGWGAVPLYAPPVADDDPHKPTSTGVTVFRFPEWYLAQGEWSFDSGGRRYRTRPLVRGRDLFNGRYQDQDRKKHDVVPVRFVRACPRGHIADIDWNGFVGAARGVQLWLDEGGAGNDFTEIFVRDSVTGRRRALSETGLLETRPLGWCPGTRPWIGPTDKEECTQIARLLTRSATNAWFAQTLPVISIPDPQEKLRKAVGRVYDPYLKECEGPDDVKYERKKEMVKNALAGISDAEAWAEVQRRKVGLPPPAKSIKQAELETLLMVAEGTSGGPADDFVAERRALGVLGPRLQGKLERVVLVHRLREVVAQLGFTRFEAVQPDINGELSIGVQRAPLGAEESWLPAIENRGEGVFISFSRAAVEKWRAAMKPREDELVRAYRKWLNGRQMDPQTAWLGLPYLMLHSLAHLLITAVSLECGYAASSIRERVYSVDGVGYGILLYTGGAGAEGTLGGLVEVGRRIEHHLERALELARLCSNDPVCSQHEPDNEREERFLHGAACHGCLLISETSCERRNEHLDRALVVSTLAAPGFGFFAEVP